MFSYAPEIDSEELYQFLLESVKGEEEVEYGFSTTLGGGVIIRIVGNYGEQLYKIMKRIEHSILEISIAELV